MTERAQKSRALHIVGLLKTAVTGQEKEFTTGSIDKAIFMLSVPMILEMLMESLFAVVDVFFVGKLGVEAVATVGLTESMLTIIYSIGIGLSMGATALVARRTGEKNMNAASHAAMQAIYVVLVIALLISILGIFFAKDLLLLMGAAPEMVAKNYRYTQILLGSNFVIMLLFMINGIFRGAGDASIAMRSLWLANILNIILCPTLINGFGPIPALGLTGAALATTIGRGTGVLYQVYHLYIGKGIIKVKPQHLKLDPPIMGNLLKIASGGTAQFLIASASWIFLIRILSHFGSNALAGYTIAIRVIVFAILPAWGMANAAATLVGQNLGAQQPERAERSVWRTAYFNMLFLAGVTVLFFFLAEPIVRIFNNNEEVVSNGTLCLRIVCLGYIFYAYGMVISQSFNGAGDTRTPTILNVFGFWMFQIPLAYVLAIVMKLGPVGVFSAISIAESAIAIAAILIFRQGKWKSVKL
ncbi:MATE family efflux transporter [Polluticoccus soli]|uniref:MATE family efflux transporter n=1 Tax=Polluticoccus soli TaxID=3034150 RepID=UPI0023E0B79A|nr:MATE family efflux transporter [Flavipsychrobacter sp. JY13-12]